MIFAKRTAKEIAAANFTATTKALATLIEETDVGTEQWEELLAMHTNLQRLRHETLIQLFEE